MIAKTTCPQCSNEVDVRHSFCGQCGYFLKSESAKPETVPSDPLLAEGKTPSSLLEQPSPGSEIAFGLRLIRGIESEELVYNLSSTEENPVGRSEGAVQLGEDPHVSPIHATIFVEEGELFVRDEGSLNGLFIRMSGSVQLKVGETFILGEQVFRIDSEGAEDAEREKEARFFSSNQRHPSTLKLSQILEGGQLGITWPIRNEGFTLGRQGCELNFPQDRFMSSRHARLARSGELVELKDLGSRNGTYLQVEGVQRLSEGDSILIGKQLLQVLRLSD
ncbi:MAG: FHA domain-containing protein [Myxococcota bacterium]|nr:FHA domain-containing protein [Myxococcota bacterium]